MLPDQTGIIWEMLKGSSKWTFGTSKNVYLNSFIQPHFCAQETPKHFPVISETLHEWAWSTLWFVSLHCFIHWPRAHRSSRGPKICHAQSILKTSVWGLSSSSDVLLGLCMARSFSGLSLNVTTASCTPMFSWSLWPYKVFFIFITCNHFCLFVVYISIFCLLH